MILVNTDYISGKELEMLGIVKGSTIQAKHVGHDILQGLKNLVGGGTFSLHRNDERCQSISYEAHGCRGYSDAC